MHYFFEAIAVGIYTTIIYLLLNILNIFNNNNYIIFFIVGFLKHFLGYFLQLHNNFHYHLMLN